MLVKTAAGQKNDEGEKESDQQCSSPYLTNHWQRHNDVKTSQKETGDRSEATEKIWTNMER